MHHLLLLLSVALVCHLPVLGQYVVEPLDQRSFSTKTASDLNPALAPFYHGVASGDPLPDKVILWTRLTPPDSLSQNEIVQYEVFRDASLTQQVTQGSLSTSPAQDFTVKVDVGGLQPGTYYYYRFAHNGTYSITGRTKTADTGNVSQLRFGVLSCQDYKVGYFHSLGVLAERNDIDLVLHTGDYIYEQGGGSIRTGNPNREIYTLQDYRTRFSQYRLDGNLARLHQVYPWTIIWDDHDIIVDALRDTSFRHNPAFGSYAVRKRAAIQAAREWLPLRDPDTLAGESFFKNWKRLPYGALADVYTIDARLYDRDRFATDVNDTIYGKPNHKFLGPEQLDWLTSNLAKSPAQWKLVVNGLQLSHFQAAGRPFILENWDGYPAERNRLFDTLQQRNVQNTVFLTGDWHCSFAIDVARNPYGSGYNSSTGAGSLCVEFIAPSVTGGNFDEGSDFGLGSPAFATNLIRFANPHYKFVNLTDHGYLLLDVTPSRAQAEFWYTQDIKTPEGGTERLAATWLSNAGTNRVQQGSGASPGKSGVPPLPNKPTAADPSKAHLAVLSVYPNPVQHEVRIQLGLTQNLSLQFNLVDVQGRAVNGLRSTETLTAGTHLMVMNVSGLDNGIYYLQLKQQDQVLRTVPLLVRR